MINAHLSQSQTPSPFRLSRRKPPTRPSAGPQFANSPRFLLSQTTPQKRDDDIDIDDDEGPPSTATAVVTPAPPRSAIPRQRRDVIVDSDDDELVRDTGVRGYGTNELVDDAIDSTPPGKPDTTGILDAEFDAVFAPVRDSNKRRRLSPGGNRTLDQKLKHTSDPMPSSPPEPGQSTADPLKTPAPGPRLSAAVRNTVPQAQATPSVSTRPPGPGISTPGNTTTPFRSKPRFMLSAKKPPSSQTPFRADTPSASQPVSPPERRKPAFVLPRPPSPSATAEDIPTPFSPSSRTLHRRGRHRSGVPGYTPGGMAAEVRSWILEMGSKREQVVTSRPTVDVEANTSKDLSGYLLAARVVRASQAVLKSSGPLAFIQAEPVSISPTEEKVAALNILAMGPPRPKPVSVSAVQTLSIQVGDLLAIHRGLAWDVEFHAFQALGALRGMDFAPSENDGCDGQKQRWLVVMEWDLIQGAT